MLGSDCSSGISPEGEFVSCVSAAAPGRGTAATCIAGAHAAGLHDRRRSLQLLVLRRRVRRRGGFCFICFIEPRPAARTSHSATPPLYDLPVRPPRVQSCARREARRNGNATANPKATILIVDDEPDVREVLEEYFAAHGYAAIGAESAAAAQALAAQHPIDLALVDINMPGEDGLSLARHLRERYAKIAIVMLTSAGTVVDRIVGLEMGADDYVPKPFDPRELRGPRQERAAPHVVRGPRRHRRRAGAHRTLRARPRRAPAHRRERARRWRCRRSSSIC